MPLPGRRLDHFRLCRCKGVSCSLREKHRKTRSPKTHAAAARPDREDDLAPAATNSKRIALREIGRIERSIFICDWLLDPKLRRRSHAILNKGESRHALARAVFLHQLGELRNRIADTMAYRASGLNLVVNAIILWNTVYLSRAVRFVHDQGTTIPRCAPRASRSAAMEPYRAHRRLSLERD